jgi:DNA-binding CsgD family transcriptional regulator/PAS domain-containing protein
MDGALVDLVGKAYEAALDPVGRTAFLETLAGHLGGPTAIQHFDLATRIASFEEAARIDPEAQEDYCAHYSKVNPWMCASRRRFELGEVVHSALLTEDDELRRTEFHAGFLDPHDLFYSMGTVVMRTPALVVTVSTIRSRSAGPYGEDEDGMFRILAGHLRRAFQMRARIAAANSGRGAFLDALERLPDGVLLTDRQGCLVYANRAGREILAAADGLVSTAEGLQGARPQDTTRLRAILKAAIETSEAKGTEPGGAVMLPRRFRRSPLSVVACSLPSHQVRADGRSAAAALFVRDPERASEEAEAVLARLYQLTTAETRLASALARGDSLDEAAQRFGITKNTARAQLRAVFEKTGVSRQGALVSLLLASLPQVRMD